MILNNCDVIWFVILRSITKQEDKIKKQEAGKLNMQQHKQQTVTEKKKIEAIQSSLQGSKSKPKKSNEGTTKLSVKGSTSQKKSKAEQKQ